VRWRAAGRLLVLDANLSTRRVDFPMARGRIIWCEGNTNGVMGPWSVRWSLEDE
jgi:hypothetical protein